MNLIKESNRDKHFKYAMKLSVPTTGLITIAMFILFKDMHPMGTFLAISIAVITAFIFLGAGMDEKKIFDLANLIRIIRPILKKDPNSLSINDKQMVMLYNNTSASLDALVTEGDLQKIRVV